jgi:uncharacterized protein (DUF983 family)
MDHACAFCGTSIHGFGNCQNCGAGGSAVAPEDHAAFITGVLNGLLIVTCLFWAPLIIALTVLL